MRESKRRKLESKGWKVGNTKDLLGLSSQEEMYIELRLKLAEGLKARRRATGITQVKLAKTIKSSQSRVAKMEAGDLERYLAELGAELKNRGLKKPVRILYGA